MESAVGLEYWAGAESFAATEVSQCASAGLVVDDGTSYVTHGSGIKIERVVVVLSFSG